MRTTPLPGPLVVQGSELGLGAASGKGHRRRGARGGGSSRPGTRYPAEVLLLAPAPLSDPLARPQLQAPSAGTPPEAWGDIPAGRKDRPRPCLTFPGGAPPPGYPRGRRLGPLRCPRRRRSASGRCWNSGNLTWSHRRVPPAGAPGLSPPLGRAARTVPAPTLRGGRQAPLQRADAGRRGAVYPPPDPPILEEIAPLPAPPPTCGASSRQAVGWRSALANRSVALRSLHFRNYNSHPFDSGPSGTDTKRKEARSTECEQGSTFTKVDTDRMSGVSV